MTTFYYPAACPDAFNGETMGRPVGVPSESRHAAANAAQRWCFSDASDSWPGMVDKVEVTDPKVMALLAYMGERIRELEGDNATQWNMLVRLKVDPETIDDVLAAERQRRRAEAEHAATIDAQALVA